MLRAPQACLLLLVLAAVTPQQGAVEITSGPSHHLVFQNGWLREFKVRKP